MLRTEFTVQRPRNNFVALLSRPISEELSIALDLRRENAIGLINILLIFEISLQLLPQLARLTFTRLLFGVRPYILRFQRTLNLIDSLLLMGLAKTY